MKFYLDGLLFVFQNVGYDSDAANIDILVFRSQNLEWPRLVVLCGNHSVLWCNCIYLYIVLYIHCCCSISLIYQYHHISQGLKLVRALFVENDLKCTEGAVRYGTDLRTLGDMHSGYMYAFVQL